MHNNLEEIIELSKSTGDRVIIYNPYTGSHLVIMALDEYKRLVNKRDDVRHLTKEQLVDRINREIAIWHSSNSEKEQSDIADALQKEITSMSDFPEKNSDKSQWSSVASVLEKESAQSLETESLGVMPQEEVLDNTHQNTKSGEPITLEPGLVYKHSGEDVAPTSSSEYEPLYEKGLHGGRIGFTSKPVMSQKNIHSEELRYDIPVNVKNTNTISENHIRSVIEKVYGPVNTEIEKNSTMDSNNVGQQEEKDTVLFLDEEV